MYFYGRDKFNTRKEPGRNFYRTIQQQQQKLTLKIVRMTIYNHKKMKI